MEFVPDHDRVRYRVRYRAYVPSALGEVKTMVKKHTTMWVDSEDLRIVKGIASFKGMRIKDYFRSLVDQEAEKFQREMKSDLPVYRRRR